MKICSIVVTFNRKDLLIENINSLLMQTFKTHILIVDNASTDGTFDTIKNRFDFERCDIEYINTGKNIGGAGGFYYGLKYAHEKKMFDYYLLMDDDGKAVNENTIELLVDATKHYNHLWIINSLVVEKDNERLSFGMGELKHRSDIATPFVEGDNNPFNGTMVSRETVDLIGYPRADFFIGCDEVEYMSRCKKYGGNVVTVCSSLYYHPNRDPVKSKFLWKTIARPVVDWRFYYRVRNTTCYYKEYSGKKKALKYGFRRMLAALIYSKKNKIKSFLLARHAFLDGYKNDFSHNDLHITKVYKKK